MPRLACLLVSLFPLAARLRCEPELACEAMAVFAGQGSAARLVAATRAARAAGLRPGMTLPQARALAPRLVARGRDAECERAAQEALLEAALGVSPRAEDAGEGVVFLDLAGLDGHYGGNRRGRRAECRPERPSAARESRDLGEPAGTETTPRATSEGPEFRLGRALAAAAEHAGLPARVGIASSKLAARVAAGLPRSPTAVPEGEEAAFLAPLPLVRLAPEAEVAAILRSWGIRSVGDLARLPENEVASRLGPVGHELHEKARGLDPRPLIPAPLPPSFREGMELEWPLVALEPFLFVARAALDRLCRRLESAGLGCARLELSLRLEPEGRHERSLALPAPTRDAKTLLTLVRLDLEARPPGAPVAGFAFTAHPDRPREAQLTLFGPAALSPDRLATTLARLFALLGPGRVGSPRPVDGHRPEAFVLEEYAPPPPPRFRPEPRAGHGLLAVRVLRPPVEVEVLTAAPPPARSGPPDGSDPSLPPIEVLPLAGRAADDGPPPPRIRGRVRVASGPWELEDGWWTEEPVEREYWDVELTDGGIYRLFHDRRNGRWFADGIYD